MPMMAAAAMIASVATSPEQPEELQHLQPRRQLLLRRALPKLMCLGHMAFFTVQI